MSTDTHYFEWERREHPGQETDDCEPIPKLIYESCGVRWTCHYKRLTNATACGQCDCKDDLPIPPHYPKGGYPRGDGRLLCCYHSKRGDCPLCCERVGVRCQSLK